MYKKTIKNKKICLVCKKNFIEKHKNHKLCSSKCSDEYNSFEYKAINGVGGRNVGWDRLRFETFKRDNFTCVYCGMNVKEDKIKLHCDHIIPKKLGGLDILDNLVTSCSSCNLGKAAISLDNTIKR